jgi:hypothetical protein
VKEGTNLNRQESLEKTPFDRSGRFPGDVENLSKRF